MWRTSWLSREVIVLPAFMASVAVWGVAHFAGATQPALVAGCVASVLAVALYVCTGMIYAAIVVVREWATPLTPLSFLLIGVASGALLAAGLAALVAPDLAVALLRAGLVTTALAGLLRAATMWRNARLTTRITLQSAIGIRHPMIRQTAQGFMGGSFNTHEFFHGRTQRTVHAARWSAAMLGCVVPLLVGGLVGGWAVLLLWLVQLVGIGAERWLFFVDAQHPQNLYYQSMA
jgi:DMSO reductase anchor subunit